MLLGIGFVTVITASITGAFVARSRQREHAEGDGRLTADQLATSIAERLERIEAGMRERRRGVGIRERSPATG